MLIVDYRPTNQGKNENPDQPTKSSTHETSLDPAPRFRWLWVAVCTVLCAVLGAVPPVSYGCYLIYHERRYYASLGPDEAACLMGGLLAMVMIYVAGPFCAIMGGASGWIVGMVTSEVSPNRTPEPPRVDG